MPVFFAAKKKNIKMYKSFNRYQHGKWNLSRVQILAKSVIFTFVQMSLEKRKKKKA